MPDKWRPPDWDERRIKAIRRVILELQHDKEVAFVESGADAIIEALRDNGVFTYGHHTPDIDIYDAPEESGHWVFIPGEP